MRRVALAATLVMMAAGCSSDGTADLDLGTVAPSSSTTTVVVTTTSTSNVSTTQPPVTTAAPTTVAATAATDPPPTEVATTAPTSKEDQVRADFETARLARAQCTFDPASCDYASIAIPGSPMDVQTRDVVAQRSEDNIRSKPGFGDARVTLESVAFEGASAFLSICVYDTVVLFDIQDPSNPSDDIVVNDSQDSYRVRWEMREQAGRWLMFEGTSQQHLTGGDLCV